MTFVTRRIGKTALEVTVLGLGSATIGGGMASLTDTDGRSVVRDAYRAGIRYVDTAPFYGSGRSEHLVGDELRGLGGWVLSSKVGRRLKPVRDAVLEGDPQTRPLAFEPWFDYSYDGTMRSYEDSLQRLGLDHIDILYIHDIDSHTHGADGQRAIHRAAMTGAYKALDELRRNGDIRAIGIGVNDAQPIAEALDHGQWDVFLLAGRYTLLEQDPLDDLLPTVERHGASIVIGGPFNSGILVGRNLWNYAPPPESVLARAAAIERVCAAHGVPLAAAALQFPLAHPVVASIIPGPRSPAELAQILDWFAADIPSALWRDLKSEGLLAASAPVPV